MPARGPSNVFSRGSCTIFDGFDGIRKNETECKDHEVIYPCLMRSPLSPCADDLNALNTSRLHMYEQRNINNHHHHQHNNYYYNQQHNHNKQKQQQQKQYNQRTRNNNNNKNSNTNIHQLKRKKRFREMIQQSVRNSKAQQLTRRAMKRARSQKTAAKVCDQLAVSKVSRFSKANKNQNKNKSRNKQTKKKKNPRKRKRKQQHRRMHPPPWHNYYPPSYDEHRDIMDIDMNMELDYDLDSSSSNSAADSQSPSLEPRKPLSSQLAQHDEAAMHAHINYFQCPISAELLPEHLNLNQLLPNLANKLDVSEAFFYAQPETGEPSVIYAKNTEFETSGQHRFVSIKCFDVRSVRCTTLGQLDCNVYFRRCPKLVLCRARHVLYLLGNAEEDKFKLLEFCLRAHQVLTFVQDAQTFRELCRTHLRCEHVLLSQFEDDELEEAPSPSSKAVLNAIPSDEFLYDCSAGRHYKRYLYVPRLRRLLRFGGVHGADDSVQYIDLHKHKHKQQEEEEEKQAWRTYENVRLPGSALSMHFSLAKNYLLFIFDWKGGGDGHGKTWIVDLLFDEHAMMQGAKSLETLFEYDFGVKVSHDYIAFLNGYSDGSMVANFNEFIPPRLARYYDCKTLLLIHRFCELGCDRFIPLSLRQLIFGFYQPFF
eukprot:CAMPEP_0202730322 /NCGR_PEP_ID=MMETSP1385-20130828/186577_1 /ASSEMBLY_ACC=CAM_ASM_000861 /TAXON_ID=933848 /ORGANISM="Elphidium margaritaceum" /LENGTH=650 /DNA_ID=CAMNT_0049396595 /DNA_START=153 /DNA_END=2105 /DNA_ORIENTATION=-